MKPALDILPSEADGPADTRTPRRSLRAGRHRGHFNQGLRLKRKGEVVLRVITEASDFPTFKEVSRRAKLDDPAISTSTVYRLIQDLIDANLIRRLEMYGAARYQRADAAICSYVVDSETGAIRGFHCGAIEGAVAAAAAVMGYRLTSYRLELLGEVVAGQAPGTPEE